MDLKFRREVTQHLFRPSAIGLENETVSFCLDSSLSANSMLAFPTDCSYCGCGNWTINFDGNSDRLVSQLSVAGSQHLFVELKRIGEAPTISDSDMPGHGSNFSCEFEDGGRDSVPVDRNVTNLLKILGGIGCPHMTTTMSRKFRNETADALAAALSDQSLFDVKALSTKAGGNKNNIGVNFTHCYVLNEYSGYQLRWSLDQVNNIMHIDISAPASDNDTWVAIGFRPLSRSFEQKLTYFGTGRHMNFGMEGADIVAGSVSGGIRSLYAKNYIGEPVPDSSLKLIYSSVEYDEGRVMVKFARSLEGGYLASNYGINASIVSTFSDIIWAVGHDKSTNSSSGCAYHNNKRGLRPIDWVNPELSFLDDWKC